MKHILLISILLLIFAFMLPYLSFTGTPLIEILKTQAYTSESEQSAETGGGPVDEELKKEVKISGILPIENIKGGTGDNSIEITVKENEKITRRTLSAYLTGVVAGEMPALYPEEALKAQAVAARTFILYRINHPHPNHPEADVCTNPACCKAFTPLEEAMAEWGEQAEVYFSRLNEACSATDGQIVVYGNEPIMAVFHASSSGKTERCADVWGEDIPYLQSVDSPEDEYVRKAELTYSECENLLKSKINGTKLDTNPAEWFGEAELSGAGGILSIRVGSIEISGSQLRSIFGLSSSRISITVTEKEIILESRGYGHGVGLSQYGAKFMALEGKNYEEILKWYYTGTHLAQITQ